MTSQVDRIGTVRLDNGSFEVTFAHDPRVSHSLRRVGARRLDTGRWRVPEALGPALARELAGAPLHWTGPAADVLERERTAAAEWREQNQRSLAIKRGEIALPSDAALMPHQQVAVAFLTSREGALLCDEQGLGKTAATLKAFEAARQRRPGLRLLIVCPNSLKHNWREEAARFVPQYTVNVIAGSRRQRIRAYNAAADIYVTNYEALRTDHAEARWLMRLRPTLLVCDEAHALKNANALTTKSLNFIRTAAAGAWLLTGTPVPNNIRDIYSQVTLADGPRALGSYEAFMARYGEAADDAEQLAALHATLDPIVLRRTKDEVLDLPERTFERRYVPLVGRQRRMYDDVRDGVRRSVESMTEAEFSASQASVLTKLLRLAQIASNPRLVDASFTGVSAKTKELDGLLEQLIVQNSRKVVVWSYYVNTIEDMLKRYQSYRPVAIFGGIDISDRAEAVRRFQDDSGTMLFIGNPQAAGTGLTLTSAAYAIYETLNWRYDLYAQSLDRIHRIGQSSNVTYFQLLADDTIDLDILDRLQSKQQVASALLGDPQSIPPLTRSEVLAILGR